MASKKQNIQEIIYAASDACAAKDEGMAQGSEPDSAEIVRIQTGMIVAIAAEHGIEIADDAAADLLQEFSATAQRRQVALNRQALVGWLPGIENADNDSAAAALTEAIGWAANSHFEQNDGKQ